MKETNAERLKRYRAEARAKGLCYVCRKRPKRETSIVCQKCHDEAMERKRLQYARDEVAGLCPGCRSVPAPDGQVHCEACLREDRERRTQRIAAGLCVSCASPAISGRTMCQRHLDDCKDRTEAWLLMMLIEKGPDAIRAMNSERNRKYRLNRKRAS